MTSGAKADSRPGFTVVHLTDLHVPGREGARVRGVDTIPRVAAVVGDVSRLTPPPAFVVITGDLAADGAAEAYRRAAALLSPLRVPVHVTFGNHDNREVFRQVMGRPHVGPSHQVIEFQGWRFLLLDSTLSGSTSGLLGDEQRRQVQAALARDECRRPTFLFLHHHVVPLALPWVDRDSLGDWYELMAIVRETSDVRAVFSGHAHQASHHEWSGVPFYVTPSAAYQFVQDPQAPRVSPESPGYRLIHVKGEHFLTEVRSVQVAAPFLEPRSGVPGGSAKGGARVPETPASQTPTGAGRIVSLSLGREDILRHVDTALACMACSRQTPHRVVCVGQRMVRGQCTACGRCVGLADEDVARLFVQEVVLQALRLPGEAVREMRRDFGDAVGVLPRHLAAIPVMLIRNALRLRQVAAGVSEREGESTEPIFKEAHSTLPCAVCGEARPHRILYLWRRVAEIRCRGCERVICMNREEALAAFAADAVVRVRRVPAHVRRELQDDFGRTVRTAPGRLIQMPMTVARDLTRLLHIVSAPHRPDKLLAG
ncbi:MAG: metallophosphoesterase [Candidatus Rokuibacteriota bacterium]